MECGQFVGKVKSDKDVERIARTVTALVVPLALSLLHMFFLCGACPRTRALSMKILKISSQICLLQEPQSRTHVRVCVCVETHEICQESSSLMTT